MKACVLDLGFGNVSAVEAWLRAGGFSVTRSSDARWNHNWLVVIPGVGNAGFALDMIMERGIHKAILEHVNNGGKILGICVGMQIFFQYLAEGRRPGLSVFPGDVLQNKGGANTGWRDVEFKKDSMPHFWQRGFGRKKNISGRAFFNHNYSLRAVNCKHESELVSVDGVVPYWVSEDYFLLQFHPEKSQVFGLNLITLIRKAFERSV